MSTKNYNLIIGEVTQVQSTDKLKMIEDKLDKDFQQIVIFYLIVTDESGLEEKSAIERRVEGQ